MAASRRYKILSLDGGGTWALIQAATLGDLFGLETKGQEILRHFDLAAGNSGGSIVLAGLACDMTPAQMLDLFQSKSKRETVFVRRFMNTPLTDGLPLPRYVTEEKLKGLSAALGPLASQPMSTFGARKDLPRLLIPAFDYDRQRVTFFRSRSCLAASGVPSIDAPLVDAIHAASNAPVYYFDQPALGRQGRYWDGAVAGYNNPVLAAVTEALAVKQERAGDGGFGLEDIRVLSIGTGSVVLPLGSAVPMPQYPVVAPRDNPGPITDIGKMALSILDDPPDAASFVAYVMLGLPLPTGEPVADRRFVRMSPMIQPLIDDAKTAWSLPAGILADEFLSLSRLQMDAVDESAVQLITLLSDRWRADAVANQAVRAGAFFLPEIGFRTYGAALQAVRTWIGDACVEH